METLFRVVSTLATDQKIAVDKHYNFAGITNRMAPASHVAQLWPH